MFIRNLLNSFFKSQSKMLDSPFKYFAKCNITNENTIKELNLMRKFKRLWREKVNYTISNEKYLIEDLKIIKKKKLAKAVVSIHHTFFINNTLDLHKSMEKQNYIFILKKKVFKWYIENVYIEDYFENIYNRISSLDIEIINNNYDDIKINFWKNKLKDIEKLAKEYNIDSYKYRSNYFEKSFPMKYQPKKAVYYARKHAVHYNKSFMTFNNRGGDCTNFVSQCLNYGDLPMTSTWKPYSYSWIRVNELYYYLLRAGIGTDITKDKYYKIGSVIQFYSNQKGFFSHSGIITSALPNGDYLYCCHSRDKLDFPLSEIYPFFYEKFRVVEIVY